MNIKLVRVTSEYKEQLFEMRTEWKNDIIVKSHRYVSMENIGE